jgi:hypothetical protein
VGVGVGVVYLGAWAVDVGEMLGVVLGVMM